MRQGIGLNQLLQNLIQLYKHLLGVVVVEEEEEVALLLRPHTLVPTVKKYEY